MDRDTELLDCFRAADVKVFASRTETQGLVLLEAMALGVPVVSTAVMGTRDVLKPGCGALVVEEDIDEFAEAVVRVLQDAELRAEMRQRELEYVRRWSADALAAQLAALYAGLMTTGPAPVADGVSP